MGFFSDIFGGKDKSALKSTKRDNAQRKAFIEQMMGQSRGDLTSLFPGAEQNLNIGAQAGLDVYGQTIPQMFDTFQQGNMGAQAALLAGMPQVHNAILGMPIDYGAFQPTQVNYDTSFAQQQVPDFVSVGDLLGGQAPQAPNGFDGSMNPGFSQMYWKQR